jgi:hypothetical protein
MFEKVKELVRNNTAPLIVLGISLAISFLIAGAGVDNVWSGAHRGR